MTEQEYELVKEQMIQSVNDGGLLAIEYLEKSFIEVIEINNRNRSIIDRILGRRDYISKKDIMLGLKTFREGYARERSNMCV